MEAEAITADGAAPAVSPPKPDEQTSPSPPPPNDEQKKQPSQTEEATRAPKTELDRPPNVIEPSAAASEPTTIVSKAEAEDDAKNENDSGGTSSSSGTLTEETTSSAGGDEVDGEPPVSAAATKKEDLNAAPSATIAGDTSKSHIIPGVEHVFFEVELDKRIMEQIVVFAADNSEPSDRAFQFYVDNVNRPGYTLHVVHHSNYWGDYEPMDGGPSPKHCEDMAKKEAAKVDEIRQKFTGLMEQHNIKGEFIILHGKDAWHDIIQHQEKHHAIMICMGTRGQNAMRRTFMGSVSDSVVHHAHCPVLVCCHPKDNKH